MRVARVACRCWETGVFALQRSHESVAKQAVSFAHGRWNRKKRVPWGERSVRRETGGTWGEIRNEREEKPTRARIRKSADEIRPRNC